MLSFLPFCGLWIWRQRHRRGLPSLRGVMLSSCVFFLVLSPWLVRNYEVFRRFVFIRDDFGLQVRLGNNNMSDGMLFATLQPNLNQLELEKFQRMGEIDSSFRFEFSPRIVHHKIREIDTPALDAVRPLNGSEQIRRGIRIVPRKNAGEIGPAQLDVPAIDGPLALHRTNQVLAANAVSRQGERGGCASADSVIQERHGASELSKVQMIKAALKLIRGIGQ